MVIVMGFQVKKTSELHLYIEYCVTLVEMCTAVSDRSLIIPIILFKCTSLKKFHIFVILIISCGLILLCLAAVTMKEKV